MKKDFSREKLLSFEIQKQFKVLYELARFIETNSASIESTHFDKLKKYHNYLSETSDQKMQKLHKEFEKIKALDYQFQIYLMLLERFVGQSLKEYEFLVNIGDKKEPAKTFPIICVLDSVRSAHNVGSFFRTAECFGCEKIILGGLTPAGDHPQVIKTAMGSEIPWEYHQNIESSIKSLKASGYEIVAIETGEKALNIRDFEPLGPTVIIFGHEQFGISLPLLQMANKTVKIPLFGKKNSLNVGVSQGIILNQIVSKLQSI